MNLFEVIILGIVQGLTEFLPISSTGHLVFLQLLFGISDSTMIFDIALHWGSLLAVMVYFYQDLFRMVREIILWSLSLFKARSSPLLTSSFPFARLGGLIIVATVPAVVFGLFFEDFIDETFQSMGMLIFGWIFTGLILIFSRRFAASQRTLDQMSGVDALLIGIAQAIAILPSVSRSGTTLVAGMSCGIKKQEAARFSFLMSIPAILGAGVLKLKEGMEYFQGQTTPMLVGFSVSLVVSYLSIWGLMRIIQKGKLHYFGYYCLGMSVVTAIYIFSRNFL